MWDPDTGARGREHRFARHERARRRKSFPRSNWMGRLGWAGLGLPPLPAAINSLAGESSMSRAQATFKRLFMFVCMDMDSVPIYPVIGTFPLQTYNL
jgi:hypothetical protein